MGFADVDGLTIHYEVAGPPDGAVVVLIAGLGHQLTWWPARFIDLLAGRGLRVVLPDNRDAGMSGTIPHAKKVALGALRDRISQGHGIDVPYTLADMAGDVAGLLNHLDVESAHLVGASLGGAIAQEFAIHYPERTMSLTSIMSSTGEQGVAVPTAEAELRLRTAPPPHVEGYVATAVETARVLHSPAHLDEPAVAEGARRDFERSFRPAGTGRQLAALWASGDRTAGLGGIDVPALVIHGELDPLTPIDGGVATANAIPGATFLSIPDMGHDLPPPLMDVVAEAIGGFIESVGFDTT